MESDPYQTNPLGQSSRNVGSKVLYHIFAGGLVVDSVDARKISTQHLNQLPIFGAVANHKRVVVPIHNLLAHNGFQHPKIHSHTKLRVLLVALGHTRYRHEKTVGVAVNLAARSIVAGECVCRLEGELFGYADFVVHQSLKCDMTNIYLTSEGLFERDEGLGAGDTGDD